MSVTPHDFQLPPLDVYADEAAGGRSARNSANDCQQHEQAGYRVSKLTELDVKPRPAVIQRIGWDEGALAAVVGVPNGGKTALAIDAGLAVASGESTWLGLKVSSGPVLYVAAEAPGSVIVRGRAALVRKYASNRLPQFYIASAAPRLGSEQDSLLDTEQVIVTLEHIASEEGGEPRLCFIDTLASCLGDGEENGAGMIRLVNAAKRIAATTTACVVLVHHPSKGDSAGLRGHGSLAAACDSILSIEVDHLTGVRTATLTKSRDSATGLQLRFELEQQILEERDHFGDPVSTVIVKRSRQAPPRRRPGGQRQQELLGELERRHRTGESQWDEASVRKIGRELGMPRNSPIDALRGLIQAGYLVGSPASLTLKDPPSLDG